MSKTNKDNLENRFDSNESVLDYFETGLVLSIERQAARPVQRPPDTNSSAICRLCPGLTAFFPRPPSTALCQASRRRACA